TAKRGLIRRYRCPSISSVARPANSPPRFRPSPKPARSNYPRTRRDQDSGTATQLSGAIAGSHTAQRLVSRQLRKQGGLAARTRNCSSQFPQVHGNTLWELACKRTNPQDVQARPNPSPAGLASTQTRAARTRAKRHNKHLPQIRPTRPNPAIDATSKAHAKRNLTPAENPLSIRPNQAAGASHDLVEAERMSIHHMKQGSVPIIRPESAGGA